jgi:hypothetical protein
LLVLGGTQGHFHATDGGTNASEYSPKLSEGYCSRNRFLDSIQEFIALGRTRNRRSGLVNVEGPQI